MGTTRIRNLKAIDNYHGIRVGQGSSVADCLAQGNGGYGITVNNDGRVTDCLVSANSIGGISAGHDCLVENNHCKSNGYKTGYGGGIHVDGKHTRVINNKCNDNARGFSILNTSNFIVQNHASGNMINYYIIASNKVGIIQIPPNNTDSITSDATISFAPGVGTTDPYANFLY